VQFTDYQDKFREEATARLEAVAETERKSGVKMLSASPTMKRGILPLNSSKKTEAARKARGHVNYGCKRSRGFRSERSKPALESLFTARHMWDRQRGISPVLLRVQ
jgi:hypothetical protein